MLGKRSRSSREQSPVFTHQPGKAKAEREPERRRNGWSAGWVLSTKAFTEGKHRWPLLPASPASATLTSGPLTEKPGNQYLLHSRSGFLHEAKGGNVHTLSHSATFPAGDHCTFFAPPRGGHPQPVSPSHESAPGSHTQGLQDTSAQIISSSLVTPENNLTTGLSNGVPRTHKKCSHSKSRQGSISSVFSKLLHFPVENCFLIYNILPALPLCLSSFRALPRVL